MSSREQELLEKYLVRNTTDIPLHERFYKLSQLHTQLKKSSKREKAIAAEEVRIQIRPFTTNPMSATPRRPAYPTSRMASNFRADQMDPPSRSSQSSSYSSRHMKKPKGSGLAMDMEPMSLSERMSRLSPLREAVRPSKKSPSQPMKKRRTSPTTISDASRTLKKKKVTQRLAVQARLGQNNQNISAKERLAKAAGVLNMKRPALKNRISIPPKPSNNKWNRSNRVTSQYSVKNSFSNIKNNKNKSKYSLNNKKKEGAVAKKKATNGKKPKQIAPNAVDLDKDLEEFMKTK